MNTTVSDPPTTIDSTGTPGAPNYYIMVKIHAAVGIFAWIGLLPCAIFVARQCRIVFPGGGKIKTWLKLHIGLIVVCVLMSAASFAIIASQINGYNYNTPVPGQAHQGLGLSTYALILVALVLSCFRMPKCQCTGKKTDKAMWWIHYFAGNAAVAMAATTSIIGVMRTAGPPWLIVFPVGVGIFHVVMNELVAKCAKPAPKAAVTQPEKPTHTNGTVAAHAHLHCETTATEETARLSTVFVVTQNGSTPTAHQPSANGQKSAAPPGPAQTDERELKFRKTMAIIYFCFLLPWVSIFAICYAILWRPNNA